MKLGNKITSIIVSGALATIALTGCSQAAEQVGPLGLQIGVPDLSVLASLPETSTDDIPADEVVEVVDPDTGETTTMTAGEAKATGKTIVPSSGSASAPVASSGNGSSQAPSASTPSAPAHTHSFSIPITQQKYVVDSPAVARIVCNGCGTTFGSVDAWGGHLTRGGTCQSYHSDSIPEKGHYETVTVGYKCSCGATQ
ncbi:MAG: hypothetical protein HFJ64_08545 [Eggerthellaceae bacterium]|nr:hypothetical protein [Eggerthellaceae bacterium]